MRRRLVALTVVPLLLLGVAACGNDATDPGKETSSVDTGETISGVEVSGEVGQAPEVKIDAPLKIDETQTEVVTAGDGNSVVEGEQALLHLYLANGTTGDKAFSTFDQQEPYSLQQVSENQFFPSVIKAIVGKPVGSRIAVAAVPNDAFGTAGNPQMNIKADDPVLFVVDVMSVEPTDVVDGPEGDPPANVPSDIPTVHEEDGNVTKLTFENAPKKPSGKLRVVPLIEGDGPVARGDSLVTFDYFGQVYGTKTVFDESYTKDPVTFPLGVGGLIKGWDEGLVGLKRGSRVLVIVPPSEGYGSAGNPQAGIKGTDTLAFVVDILGVDEPS